jgi:thiamine-phosphate pyrophosphorylase
MLSKLQYISHGVRPENHLQNIHASLDAGIQLVQLRIKNVDEKFFLDHALKTKELCMRYHAQLIINDHPAVALACGANGVHLGLEDMKIFEARKIAPDVVIGGTANTIDHIKERCKDKVDYIGLGPFRFTNTKEKLSPILGLEGYRAALQQMQQAQLSVPVYAIGGIQLKDIAELIDTGVFGIAVSGLLTEASNKNNLVKEINKILYHA